MMIFVSFATLIQIMTLLLSSGVLTITCLQHPSPTHNISYIASRHNAIRHQSKPVISHYLSYSKSRIQASSNKSNDNGNAEDSNTSKFQNDTMELRQKRDIQIAGNELVPSQVDHNRTQTNMDGNLQTTIGLPRHPTSRTKEPTDTTFKRDQEVLSHSKAEFQTETLLKMTKTEFQMNITQSDILLNITRQNTIQPNSLEDKTQLNTTQNVIQHKQSKHKFEHGTIKPNTQLNESEHNTQLNASKNEIKLKPPKHNIELGSIISNTLLNTTKNDTELEINQTISRIKASQSVLLAVRHDVEHSWPEPEPRWDVAHSKWGILWELYAGSFAVLFFVISIWTLLLLLFDIRELRQQGTAFSHRGNFSVFALHAMLLSCFTTRCLFLSVAAIARDVHFLVLRLFYTIGTPGLTAAYMNLVIIIVDSTRATIGKPRFLKIQFVIGLYLFHLALAVVSDFLVMVEFNVEQSKYLLLASHCLFIAYGYFTSIGFIYACLCLAANMRSSRWLEDSTTSRLKLLRKLSVMCAFVSFCLGTVNLYHATGDMGIFTDDEHAEPWNWLLVHTIKRFFEFCSGVLVLLAFMNTGKSKSIAMMFRRMKGIIRRQTPESHTAGISLARTIHVTPSQSKHEVVFDDGTTSPATKQHMKTNKPRSITFASPTTEEGEFRPKNIIPSFLRSDVEQPIIIIKPKVSTSVDKHEVLFSQYN